MFLFKFNKFEFRYLKHQFLNKESIFYLFSDLYILLLPPMTLQPIEGHGLSTDCGLHFHFSVVWGEKSSSQFRSDVWSVCKTPQPLLTFFTEIIATNRQLPKSLTMLCWHRSHTLADNSPARNLMGVASYQFKAFRLK